MSSPDRTGGSGVAIGACDLLDAVVDGVRTADEVEGGGEGMLVIVLELDYDPPSGQPDARTHSNTVQTYSPTQYIQRNLNPAVSLPRVKGDL